MNNTQRLSFAIQIFALAIPIMFLEHIKNPELRLSIILFILIFYGYGFFRILETNLQQLIRKDETYVKDKYAWIGVILQVIILLLFYQYSVKLFDVVKN